MDETMAHHSRSLANQASHAGEWVTSKNPLNAREFTAKFWAPILSGLIGGWCACWYSGRYVDEKYKGIIAAVSLQGSGHLHMLYSLSDCWGHKSWRPRISDATWPKMPDLAQDARPGPRCQQVSCSEWKRTWGILMDQILPNIFPTIPKMDRWGPLCRILRCILVGSASQTGNEDKKRKNRLNPSRCLERCRCAEILRCFSFGFSGW